MVRKPKLNSLKNQKNRNQDTTGEQDVAVFGGGERNFHKAVICYDTIESRKRNFGRSRYFAFRVYLSCPAGSEAADSRQRETTSASGFGSI